MLKTIPASVTIFLLTAMLLISGCNNQAKMFQKPTVPLTTVSAPTPAAAPMQPNPAAPYVLSAQSSGPYIDFSIYNLGTTDLIIKKEHFAVIEAENRAVTPYTKATTIIDLPQPAIVKPNSTLSGRAIFREVNAPIGKRLVFKPDAIGTFADISRATMLP